MATQNSKTRKTLFNNQHVVLPGADLYRGDCLAILPGLACKIQGKHFTGIEASRHYFQVAAGRLQIVT